MLPSRLGDRSSSSAKAATRTRSRTRPSVPRHAERNSITSFNCAKDDYTCPSRLQSCIVSIAHSAASVVSKQQWLPLRQ